MGQAIIRPSKSQDSSGLGKAKATRKQYQHEQQLNLWFRRYPNDYGYRFELGVPSF